MKLEVNAPEFGTLAEIGAKVGDVVDVFGGPRWEIIGGCAEKGFIINDPVAPMLSRTLPFRIISRASGTGPVRTVTRKEIVPGVYGNVKVHDPGSKFVRINVDAAMSADELRAAISTLQEIADHLDSPSA